MNLRILQLGFLFFILPLTKLAMASACDTRSYMKVVAACYTGRASGFELPFNPVFGEYGGMYTSSWNYGSYSAEYNGPAFIPSGSNVDAKASIMPPYSWGAVGQVCDINYEPTAHAQCVASLEPSLTDPTINAQYNTNQFYWKKHGHNCHDAAEDVGMCLLNAASHMPANCELDAKVIVWDAEPDITKALGDVYHSQVLVQMIRQNPITKNQEPVVCLTESQVANHSGVFPEACCSPNLSLLHGGTAQEYDDAFRYCDFDYTRRSDDSIHPHIYNLETFRIQRQTGEMDVPTSYDRNAGIHALEQPERALLGGKPPKSRIISAAYDRKGVPIALNIK